MKINWSSVFESVTIDEKLDKFNNIISIYDKHAPVKPVKIKHLPAPCLSESIKKNMNKRNRAEARRKIDRYEYDILKYKSLRNRCNTMCRDAQRRYIHDYIEKSELADVWKFLRSISIGIGKFRNNSVPINNNLDELNQRFNSSATVINDSFIIRALHDLSSLPTPDYQPFIFRGLTDNEVKKTIVSFSSNAVGSDTVSQGMLLPILDLIIPNFSLSTGIFPNLWKNALIIP